MGLDRMDVDGAGQHYKRGRLKRCWGETAQVITSFQDLFDAHMVEQQTGVQIQTQGKDPGGFSR